MVSISEEQLLEIQNLQLKLINMANNIYVWFEDRTVTPFCTKEKSFTIIFFYSTA
jgi:hypothetical protein